MRKLESLFLEVERFIFDFLTTFLLVWILYVLGLLILGFNGVQIILSDNIQDLTVNSLILAFIISILHWVFCLDAKFFRKFGFLLPEDITYYIFVRNGTCSNLENKQLVIKTPDKSEHILSYPVLKEGCLSYIIDNLVMGEIRHFFLLLHTNKAEDNTIYRTLIIPHAELNKDLKIWWGSPDHSPDHMDGETGLMENLYLLVSKNIILIISRFLLFIIIFTCVLSFNPPINLVVDPQQIEENMTKDQEKVIVMSIKNIGCDLNKINVSISDKIIELLDNKWTSRNDIKLSGGAIEQIRFKIGSATVGEYRGFITISASGGRDHTMIDSLKETGIKTISSIPFKLRVIN